MEIIIKAVNENMTAVIQKAIDDCFLQGGGKITLEEGTYEIGGIRLRSNVTLHLLEGARLIGSRNLDDYKVFFEEDPFNPIPENYLPEYFISTLPTKRAWFNGFIVIYNEKNVSIIGEKDAVIDGQNCYNPNGEEKFRGPHCITVIHCENLLFKGYTIDNSSNWAHSVWASKNILVENVTVIAGHDGVHFTICDDIIVRNCQFYTGDDCIAGGDNRNVLIEDCILNASCNALRFSGLHVLVQRCHAYGPGKYVWRSCLTTEEKEQGVVGTPNENRFNTLRGFFNYFIEGNCFAPRFVPSDIVIRDCTVENPQRLISYFVTPDHPWFNRPAADITFENIKATGVYVPIFLYAFEDANIANITLKNCDISFLEDRRENVPFKVGYCNRITLQNVTTNTTCTRHIACFGSQNGDIIIEGGNVNAPTEKDCFTSEDFEKLYV